MLTNKLTAGIRVLNRRLVYLMGRVRDARAAGLEARGYDIQEIKAIKVAIGCIRLAHSYGVVALTNFGDPLFEGQGEAASAERNSAHQGSDHVEEHGEADRGR